MLSINSDGVLNELQYPSFPCSQVSHPGATTVAGPSLFFRYCPVLLLPQTGPVLPVSTENRWFDPHLETIPAVLVRFEEPLPRFHIFLARHPGTPLVPTDAVPAARLKPAT